MIVAVNALNYLVEVFSKNNKTEWHQNGFKLVINLYKLVSIYVYYKYLYSGLC